MDEKILLRVWPEFGSTGIWMPPKAGGQLVGPNVSYESLELPIDLINDFIAWQDIYSNQKFPDDDTIDWEAFGATGLELAKRLKIHLFYKADVEYEWEGIQKIYAFKVVADYHASLECDDTSVCALEDIEEELEGYAIPDRDALQKRFDAWEKIFDYVALHNEDWGAFNQEGETLVKELQEHLPGYCVVFYEKAYEEDHPQWWK